MLGPRGSLRRKITIGVAVALAVLVVAFAVLWSWKPWVPPIELVDAGERGERIVEDGLFANHYPADDPIGAVLLLGGSDGGISLDTARTATALQDDGFTVLALSYFGAPGQSPNLELVPLETFDRALAWLRSHPDVPDDRIAVMGTSKGAEAALLIGTRHPELRAVVAGAPSSAAWPGIDWSSLNADASWSVDGEPIDTIPYAGFHPAILLGDIGRLYADVDERLPRHPKAAIPVERIEGPVLLVCGEADRLWPACPMSRQLEARAADAVTPSVRVVSHDRGGHAVLGPPLSDDDPIYGGLDRWGGSAADNNAARAGAWPQVLDFLRRHVAEG